MFRNVLKTPVPERLPDNIRFNDRVNYALVYYLENDLPFLFPEQAKKIAEDYRIELINLEILNRKTGKVTKGRPQDYQLVMKVVRDVTKPHGSEPLGKDMILRTSLIFALCEHLGVDRNEVVSVTLDKINEFACQNSIHPGVLGMEENIRLRVAAQFIEDGLIYKGYLPERPLKVDKERDEIELKEVPTPMTMNRG